MSDEDDVIPFGRPRLIKPQLPEDFCHAAGEGIRSLASDGEPVPTGIPWLDARLRRGGLLPGRVICIGGPPFTGKTNIVCEAALNLSKEIPVFCLFSDEGRTQAEIRIGVMLGIPVEQIEEDPVVSSDKVLELLSGNELRMIMPETEFSNVDTIFEYIHEQWPEIKESGSPFVVILDSTQTIPAHESMNGDPERIKLDEFMRVCRRRAESDHCIVIITSQANRASYKSRNLEENSVAMASLSGTSKIEYLSDLVLSLSLPDDESEIIRAEFAKNRMGHFRRENRKPRVLKLRYDDSSGRMMEVDKSEEEKENQIIEVEKLRPVCSEIKEALKGFEKSKAELERMMRGKGNGFGTMSVRAALHYLVDIERSVTALYREGRGGGYFYALR